MTENSSTTTVHPVSASAFDAEAFKRGAEETALDFRAYFLNEDEYPMYNVSTTRLDELVAKAVKTAIASPGDALAVRAADTQAIVSESFERGAVVTATVMHGYFLNEDKTSAVDVSLEELTSFRRGAISDALWDEKTRNTR